MESPKFIGSPLSEGPLPAVFYFSLSAHDSLHLDPYNQPALFLTRKRLRVFSMTLPGHDQLPPKKAMEFWEKGEEVLLPFIEQTVRSIEGLIDEGVILAKKVGVMGLSRGVFIGAHVAARSSHISHLLGFAPLTKFRHTPSLDLIHLHEKLYSKSIRCYIGNRDTCVSTDACFEWIRGLADTAYERGIRSSPIELKIGPSIGHQGHGTLPPVFEHGTDWLAAALLNLKNGNPDV